MSASNGRAAFITDELDVGPLALPWLSASEDSDTDTCCAEFALRADGTVLLTFTYDFGRNVLEASQETMRALFAAIKAGGGGAIVEVGFGVDVVSIAGFRFVPAGGKVRMFLESDPALFALADRDELAKMVLKIREGRFDRYVTTPVATGAAA